MKEKAKFIGIDVGGTKILLETFNAKLRRLKSVKTKTVTGKGRKGFLGQLYELIDGVFEKSIKGIGIVVPGIVDIHKGTLVKAPHLPTGKNLPLKRLLEKRYRVPVRVDNDINAFLVAEMQRGRLKNKKNIIALMIGTGVGGAALADGKLLYGSKGLAGEMGHMVLNKSKTLQTFEQCTSGYYIPKIAKAIGVKKKVGAYSLECLLKKRSSDGKRIRDFMTDHLATGLSNLNLIFNPEVILLGGTIYHIYLASQKTKLKKVITTRSLANSSPEIIDANPKTSLAKGAVLLFRKYVLKGS